MAKRNSTVDDLLLAIRSQIDEENQDVINDEEDILPALNRAQDYALDIFARHYEDPFLASELVDLQNGVQDYDIPENAFEDRLAKVEIRQSATLKSYIELPRISYKDASPYENASTTSVPYYYGLVGRKIRLYPAPSGVYDMRIWYVKIPDKLVKSEGRITSIGSDYVVVEGLGSSITTEGDNLNNYINLVDSQTGEIKGTCQVQAINDTRITFKSTPDRTSVLNRTVTDLATVTALALDDKLAIVEGTCVPYFARPLTNFLIQFSVAELKRKLGGEAGLEEQVLQKFEKQVESTWTNRQSTLRVKKRSRNWDLPFRKWFTTNS